MNWLMYASKTLEPNRTALKIEQTSTFYGTRVKGYNNKDGRNVGLILQIEMLCTHVSPSPYKYSLLISIVTF